jgi:hypothetical protein
MLFALKCAIFILKVSVTVDKITFSWYAAPSTDFQPPVEKGQSVRNLNLSKKLSSIALFASILAVVACGAGGDHDPSVVSGGDGTDSSNGTDISDYQGYGPEFGEDVTGARCEGTETVRAGEFDVPLCTKSNPEPDPVPEAPVAPPAEAPPAEAPPADVPAPEAPAPEAPPAAEPPAVEPPVVPTSDPPAEAPPAEEPPVDTQAPEQPAPEPTPEEPAPTEPPAGVCDNPEGACDMTDVPPVCELPPEEPSVCKEGKYAVCHVPGHDERGWEKRFTLCLPLPAVDADPVGADHVGHGDLLGACTF